MGAGAGVVAQRSVPGAHGRDRVYPRLWAGRLLPPAERPWGLAALCPRGTGMRGKPVPGARGCSGLGKGPLSGRRGRQLDQSLGGRGAGESQWRAAWPGFQAQGRRRSHTENRLGSLTRGAKNAQVCLGPGRLQGAGLGVTRSHRGHLSSPAFQAMVAPRAPWADVPSPRSWQPPQLVAGPVPLGLSPGRTAHG